MEPKLENKKILRLLERYQPIWALGYLSSIASWDLNTYLPEGGITLQASAMAKAASLVQSMFLDKEFVRLIEEAGDEKELNLYEAAIVKRLQKKLDQFKKIPQVFLEEFKKLTSEAHAVWRKAKADNDYKTFQPHLKKIIEMSIQRAEYLGYKDSPYDALIDNFDEGMTKKDYEKYFLSIKDFLKNLVRSIQSSPAYLSKHPLADEPYEKERALSLTNKILSFLNYDPKKLRIDISAHPVTFNFSSGHSRITTWYHNTNIKESLFATVHEFGHALHGLQLYPLLSQTPIASCSSLTIAESQSRFWENFIGNSPTFIERFYPALKELGSNFGRYSPEDYYRYFNVVRPSPVRVTADEVTYHFHIMIRFELEEALISKKISVDDLVEAWNSKYKEYLGVEPKNFSEGVLQDVHWSSGAVGYFATYSTGTTLSATWKVLLEKELGEIEPLTTSKEGIEKIKAWLRNYIHSNGDTFTLKELVHKTTGGDLDTTPLKNYLQEKYRKIYPPKQFPKN